MKVPVFIVFVFFAFFFTLENGLAQQLSDEVQSKLSESDQKKLTKFDETFTKGDLILSKAGYPGDENLLNSQDPDNKLNKKYFSRRIEATDYYRVANGGRFTIFERNIKDFWKRYTEEHYKLDDVKMAELKANMQFQEAQQYRKDATKNPKLKDWLPLILKAEENEKQALLQLQKVLFVYLNYPARYNEAWFKTDTVAKKTDSRIAKADIKPDVKPEVTPKVKPVAKVTTDVQPIDTPITDVKKEEKKAPKIETKADSSIYSMVGIDETQIDIFNNFLQKQYPKDYEKYIIDFATIDYSNLQSLRNAWYNYKFGVLEDSTQYYAEHNKPDSVRQMALVGETGKSQPLDPARKDARATNSSAKTSKDANTPSTGIAANKVKPDISSKDISKSFDKTTVAAVVSTNSSEKSKSSKSGAESKSVSNGVSRDQKSITEAATSDSKSMPGNKATEIKTNRNLKEENPIAGAESATKGFLYKVQIAACREALSAGELSGIYNGKEQIAQTFEDQWYKYTVGNFTTHNEARQLRDALSVPGVFVVAYLNGKRIKLSPSPTGQWEDESLPADIRPELIQFRIQIAASHNELSASVLKDIYNGTSEIISVHEGDWYKYSVLAGNTLGNALEMIKNIDVAGAFIVAYYNNQKINLLSAIRLTNR